MSKQHWYKFSLLEKGVLVLLMVLTILNIIVQKILVPDLLNDVLTYMFFLSLGLYLGFRLCKTEYTRMIKRSMNNESQSPQVSKKK